MLQTLRDGADAENRCGLAADAARMLLAQSVGPQPDPVAEAVLVRDKEWMEAIHPGNLHTEIGRLYRTPAAYAGFAHARMCLEMELSQYHGQIKDAMDKISEHVLGDANLWCEGSDNDPNIRIWPGCLDALVVAVLALPVPARIYADSVSVWADVPDAQWQWLLDQCHMNVGWAEMLKASADVSQSMTSPWKQWPSANSLRRWFRDACRTKGIKRLVRKLGRKRNTRPTKGKTYE